MAKYRKSQEIESTNYCCYGCGNKAKFVSPGGKEMCESSHNRCPANKKKNSDAIKTAHREGRIPGWNSIKNLNRGWSKGLTGFTDSRIKKNYDPTNVFSYDGVGPHKKILTQKRGHACECCGNNEWLGSPITLELDHIDGNNRNNVEENLRLLCPNCHSMTDTWRGRNKNSGNIKVTDKELVFALSKNKNIRQALISVGLAAKGENYKRCHEIISMGLVELVNTP